VLASDRRTNARGSDPEILPLPPILGERDRSNLRDGDVLTLSIFGTGEIREIDDRRLVMAFADGETREFRRT
jgi:hypothetical protein